eukprot:gnl/Carplike_NY0171/2927_a3936_299.p1 GENE.gnl/Carplike_NY0171/2927_a3936_299~~gnl/Carplike_NY0171/2927_a3936_299.p1  ORF type:complete len:482 (+),score=103.36 gnl/Carplike_NY0171/2927_a3936_299:182-1627(+)
MSPHAQSARKSSSSASPKIHRTPQASPISAHIPVDHMYDDTLHQVAPIVLDDHIRSGGDKNRGDKNRTPPEGTVSMVPTSHSEFGTPGKTLTALTSGISPHESPKQNPYPTLLEQKKSITASTASSSGRKKGGSKAIIETVANDDSARELYKYRIEGQDEDNAMGFESIKSSENMKKPDNEEDNEEEEQDEASGKCLRCCHILKATDAPMWISFIAMTFTILLCFFLAIISLVQSKSILFLSHDIGSLSVLASESIATSTGIVLAEVGSLSPTHASLSRSSLLSSLETTITDIAATYESVVEGNDMHNGIVEKFPLSMPLIFSETCLNLGNTSCSDDEMETFHDVVDAYVLDLTALVQAEETEGPLTADFDNYITLNSTGYDKFVGGLVTIDNFLYDSIGSKANMFVIAASLMFIGALVLPLILLYVSKKEVNSAIQQRDLVFTTWEMVPVNSIPTTTQAGRDICLLVLFLKGVNQKLRDV